MLHPLHNPRFRPHKWYNLQLWKMLCGRGHVAVLLQNKWVCSIQPITGLDTKITCYHFVRGFPRQTLTHTKRCISTDITWKDNRRVFGKILLRARSLAKYWIKMTLTDKENNEIVDQTSDMPEKLNLPTMDIGESLQQVLVQARDQGRVTCGVYQCTQLLQIEPTEVMLCILPEKVDGDVSMQIHFTLLEAFCWENGIRVIKVDDADKLSVAMVMNREDNDVAKQRSLNDVDCSCLLIEYPQDQASAADEDVLAYYKMTCDVYPQPVVELPG